MEELNVVDEQVIDTTVQEPTPEVKEVEKSNDQVVPTFATKEEYDKFVQSTSSKAKGELLKEIGLDKVADIKDLIEKGKTVSQIAEELDITKKQAEELKTQLNTYETNDLLKEVGIDQEYKDIFLTLIDADKGDGTRKEKALRVKEKISRMIGSVPKVGGEKQPSPTVEQVTKKTMADLRKL